MIRLARSAHCPAPRTALRNAPRMALLAGLLLCAPMPHTAHAQANPLAVHDLHFYVHRNLVDANGLAFYQQLVDEGMLTARRLLEGEQGPFDSACCTGIERASLQVFDGTDAGGVRDDLDILDFDADLPALESIAAGMPTNRNAVFIVTAISMCGTSTNSIGCAETPPCAGGAENIAAVSGAAIAQGLFGAVLAHERGHNACLVHVSNATCELMRATAGGGCLQPAECSALRSAANGPPGATCACHADASSALVDGTRCAVGPVGGVCSGGLCGGFGSEASSALRAAADTAGAGGVDFSRWVEGSGGSGDWRSVGGVGAALRPTGLAFARTRGVLYGVAPSGPSDAVLVELDGATGSVLRTMPLAGLAGLISLAFDPGPSASPDDDRLLAVERAAGALPPGIDETLREIDPDDGSSRFVCTLANNSELTTNGFFQGLAYDAAAKRLYGAGEAGLREIVPGFPLCDVSNEIAPPGAAIGATFARDGVGLAWNGRLYMAGSQVGPATLFDVVDGPRASAAATLGIDELAVGGLAAFPVPEPGAAALGGAAAGTLALLARRARRG